MRKFLMLISLLTFIVMTASIASPAMAGESIHNIKTLEISQTNRWVIRLASDFTIIQSNIDEMITHYNVSDNTKARLHQLEQSLRFDVARVVNAMNAGDNETVLRYLPAIARQVQSQILVLTINDDVTREWAAARTAAQDTM